MKNIFNCIKAFLVFTIVFGLAYPVFIFFIAQGVMPDKANGSLIRKDGNIIGSGLIGQDFTAEKYFHSRPSVNNYDASNSGGSNLGPSSKVLLSAAGLNINKIIKENNLKAGETLPADMALASASGLDPHISVKNAEIQLVRVARARKLSAAAVKQMITRSTEPDLMGLWGRRGVNVLKLNISLDESGAKGK